MSKKQWFDASETAGFIEAFELFDNDQLIGHYPKIEQYAQRNDPKEIVEENAYFHVLASRGRKLLGLEFGYQQSSVDEDWTPWVTKTDEQKLFVQNVGQILYTHEGNLIGMQARKISDALPSKALQDADDVIQTVFLGFFYPFFNYDAKKGRLFNFCLNQIPDIKNKIEAKASGMNFQARGKSQIYANQMRKKVARLVEELKALGDPNPMALDILRLNQRQVREQTKKDWEAKGIEYTYEDLEDEVDAKTLSLTTIENALKHSNQTLISLDEEWQSPFESGIQLTTSEYAPERSLITSETQTVVRDAIKTLKRSEQIALTILYSVDLDDTISFSSKVDPSQIGAVKIFVDAVEVEGRYQVTYVDPEDFPVNLKKIEDYELGFFYKDRYIKLETVNYIIAFATKKLLSSKTLGKFASGGSASNAMYGRETEYDDLTDIDDQLDLFESVDMFEY